MTRRTAVGLAVCGLLLAAPALRGAGADEVDITGHYQVENSTKDHVLITREGDFYQIRWNYSSGVWVGVGLREGDRLSVGWQRIDGANLGVSVFRIVDGEKGPKLVSRWAAYGDKSGKTGRETLLFMKRAD